VVRQVVSEEAQVKVAVVELVGGGREERAAQMMRIARQEARRPFDLERGPLLRATLLRLGEQEHVLVGTVHHIAFDGWSTGVFLRELAVLYEAFASGRPSPLGELRLQYGDFAHWQRQWLAGGVLDEQMRYWRERLGGVLGVLDLPSDRARPPLRSYAGASQSMMVEAEVAEGLRAFSQREGVTLFMTLLAAFSTLLHRYTGAEDVVVGSPIANRNREEIEGLIGFFSNTLVLRNDLSGDPSFRELLQRVREVTLGAYAHQDVPFEKLVEELATGRDMSRTPLFQVMFVLQGASVRGSEMAQVKAQVLELDSGTAKFDLLMSIEEVSGGLYVMLEYSTDLFDGERMRRLLGHYGTLLKGVVADGGQRLSRLPMLTEAERDQLEGWNATGRDYGVQRCLHEMVEEQVERTPEAVAVVYEGEELSYAALNRRANQLAHWMRRRGVGAEVLVGVCVERSLDMVVALLAILKAGGAYVPLDPHSPPQRLAAMVEEGNVPLLLTHSEHREALSASRARVFCLDEVGDDVRRESADDCDSRVTPDNLAYVIFTSGSTGRPKGAMNTHRGIRNRISWMQEEYGLAERDRVLQKTPFTFDVSVWEFFWPLIAGARLVVARPDGHRDPVYLVDLIRAQKITTLHFVPSMLAAFLEQEDLSGCACVERVMCSGEALPAELRDRFFARMESQLHNLYGPTEAAVDVTFWHCRRDDREARVPIGRPIANTQIHLLDGNRNPVPVGVPGELYIGGVAVGRGYVGNPALTSQVFLDDSFSGEAGAKLYKTGDLAVRRADGAIEFLGRLDNQVKLRGFRIELGEVEAVLGSEGGVREVAVVMREDTAGDPRLVAYLVGKEVPGAGELRARLRERLPEYMIPSSFEVLEALPLNANGKLDRRALPRPKRERSAQGSGRVAPRDGLELELMRLWEECLEVRPIGVTEDFFELGGHSLLAVRLMFRIRSELGQDLPLATLFQAPTIERQAGLLRRRAQAKPWRSLVAIQPRGTRPGFFCVHPSGGHALCYVELARLLGEEQPFYGLQARGLDGRLGAHERIEDMAADYLLEVREAQGQGPYLLGGLSFGGVVAFEMAQQLKRRGEEVGVVALLDTAAPGGSGEEEELEEAQRVLDIATSLARFYGQRLDLTVEELRGLGRDEQWERVYERARSAGLLPEGFRLEDVRRYGQVDQANGDALRRYVPQPYEGRVYLFRAREGEVKAKLGADRTLGWGRVCRQGVEVIEVPGDHLTIITQPHVPVLAQALQSCLLPFHSYPAGRGQLAASPFEQENPRWGSG
jgi:amino acid adenylation domain-containing protein